MKKQTVEFMVRSKNGIVTGIGKSVIVQPKTDYKPGKGIKWYEDKPRENTN